MHHIHPLTAQKARGECDNTLGHLLDRIRDAQTLVAAVDAHRLDRAPDWFKPAGGERCGAVQDAQQCAESTGCAVGILSA